MATCCNGDCIHVVNFKRMQFVESFEGFETDPTCGCIYMWDSFTALEEYWLQNTECSIDHLRRVDYLVGMACKLGVNLDEHS